MLRGIAPDFINMLSSSLQFDMQQVHHGFLMLQFRNTSNVGRTPANIEKKYLDISFPDLFKLTR